MLHLRATLSERKARLLLCACFRRVPTDRDGGHLLSLAERFADGLATDGERRRGERAAVNATTRASTGLSLVLRDPVRTSRAWEEAARIAGYTRVPDYFTDGGHEAWRAVLTSEAAWQADVVRDVFGNPFRPATFDPAWRTSTAFALSRLMY